MIEALLMSLTFGLQIHLIKENSTQMSGVLFFAFLVIEFRFNILKTRGYSDNQINFLSLI